MRRVSLALAALAFVSGCVTRPEAAEDGYPAKLSAVGTEPFWSFSLDRGSFGYTTPDIPAPRTAMVARQGANGALVISGSFAGQPLKATIRRERCSDGMSDRAYPMAVTLTIEGQTLAGCGQPRS